MSRDQLPAHRSCRSLCQESCQSGFLWGRGGCKCGACSSGKASRTHCVRGLQTHAASALAGAKAAARLARANGCGMASQAPVHQDLSYAIHVSYKSLYKCAHPSASWQNICIAARRDVRD
eukprot:364912-Chlamydomonas_euryale.AAC.18